MGSLSGVRGLALRSFSGHKVEGVWFSYIYMYLRKYA